MSAQGYRRGAAYLLVSQWGRYGIQLISVVLLSRLLPAGDFGLIAMTTAVIGLATVIGTFGLSFAALREAELSQAQKSTLFWVNTAVGVLTAGLVLVLSGPIAALYGDPRVSEIARALAITFVANGMAVQLKVELNRQRRFSALGLAEVVSQALALLCALWMALTGFGYWALVAQQVIASIALLAIAGVQARWLPTKPSWSSEAMAQLRFGRDTLVIQIANYITSNADSLLIGRQFGAIQLGAYNRAFQVVATPSLQIVAPLTQIVLPRLARAANPSSHDATLVRLQSLVGYALLGPLSLIVATATPGIPILLGSGWEVVSGFVQILALGAVFRAFSYGTYWGFLSSGKSAYWLRTELPARGVALAAMVAGAQFSASWVAAGAALGQGLIWVLGLFFGSRVGIPTGRLTAAIAWPTCLFGTAAGGSLLAGHLTGMQAGWAGVGVAAAAWVLVIGVSFATRRGREAALEVYRFVRGSI